MIQRYTRGSFARGRRNDIMNDREAAARIRLLQVLAAQAEWAHEHHGQLQKRLVQKGLDDKIKQSKRHCSILYDEIWQHEYDYLELRKEKSRLSPRAVQQTWADELDNDIAQHRKWITDKKTDALFGSGLKLRQMEESKTNWLETIDNAEWELKEVG